MFGQLRESSEALSKLWERKLRWVKAAKLHMTWFFLGDIDLQQVPELNSCLSSVVSGKPSGEIAYDRLEFWPSPRKPRQLVMTAKVVPQYLQTLGADIRRSLAEFAVKPEERDFRPHITLLRFDVMSKPADKVPLSMPEWLQLNSVFPLVHNIKVVDLIESHMGGGRDDYEVLHSFSLQ